MLIDVRDLCRGLSQAQFEWSPGNGRWSINQCLDHLTAAHRKFAAGIRRKCEGAALQRGPVQVHSSIFGRFYRWLLEPPVRLRLPAPKPFLPAAGAKPVDLVLEDFLQIHQDLAGQIEVLSTLDVSRISVSSPVSRRLRLNLYDAFRTIAAHGRRHLWQARQVKESNRFPRDETARKTFVQ